MVRGVMLNVLIAVFLGLLIVFLALSGNVAIIIGMSLGAAWWLVRHS